MKIRELADYCKSIDIDCEKCKHQEECRCLGIGDHSPYGIIKSVDNNADVEMFG